MLLETTILDRNMVREPRLDLPITGSCHTYIAVLAFSSVTSAYINLSICVISEKLGLLKNTFFYV